MGAENAARPLCVGGSSYRQPGNAATVCSCGASDSFEGRVELVSEVPPFLFVLLDLSKNQCFQISELDRALRSELFRAVLAPVLRDPAFVVSNVLVDIRVILQNSAAVWGNVFGPELS